MKTEQTIHNKIKEVQNYFKGKIVSGDYEIIDYDRYITGICVDEKYPFTFWTGNGAPNIGIYFDCGYKSFMDIKFIGEEKKIIWDYLNTKIEILKARKELEKN